MKTRAKHTGLTDAWFTLNQHELQDRLYRTTARFPVVVAGRGSGKTELSRRKIVRMLNVTKPWANPIYVYGLPTYQQAKRVAWEPIKALVPKHWTAKEFGGSINESDLIIKTRYGSTLYVVGMDKPYRIEGIQIDGAVLDECSDQKPEAYTRTLLPMLTHRKGFCWRIGKPKRSGIGAAAFEESFNAGLLPNDIGLESYNWRSDTVLTPDEIDDIRSQLGQQEADEELNAEWLKASGGIYYSFVDDVVGNGNLDSAAVYQPGMRIGVGVDFNVDPMAWIMFHVIDGKMFVFDELWIKNTNTKRSLDDLAARYPEHSAGWVFIGDASGQNRHSSAESSDYIQIMNDKRFKNSKMIFPAANPRVADRYAAVNAKLCNALGERQLFIHPKCKMLRKDLMQSTYKEGTRDFDNTDKMAGHITDALGYPVQQLWPIRVGNRPAKVQLKLE
jgi:hypothetical protein